MSIAEARKENLMLQSVLEQLRTSNYKIMVFQKISGCIGFARGGIPERSSRRKLVELHYSGLMVLVSSRTIAFIQMHSVHMKVAF